MIDGGRGLDLRDEDKLPWLEPVEDLDYQPRVSPLRLAGGALGALLILALVIGGVIWFKHKTSGTEGDGSLIRAEAGDYKVKPEEPGGMAVAGEGDVSFATSEGAEATGRIDTSALPEAPVEGNKVAAAPAPPAPVPAGPAATVKVEDGGKLPTPAVQRPTGPALNQGPVPAGSQIQLGAYNSEAIAKSAWTRMSKRFAFLADLDHVIIPVKVGENTLYRLRANAGSSGHAAELCGKLKVAGENCIIATN